MRTLIAAQRAALRQTLGRDRGNAAWRACTEMCGGATRGQQVEEALSAALELAARAEDLASKSPGYTAQAVRNAIADDRRADGHATFARVRKAGGKREWRRLDEIVPMSPLTAPEADAEAGERRAPALEDYALRPDDYPSDAPAAAGLWERVLEAAMERDPEAVTAWQMRSSHMSGSVIAEAAGHSEAQGWRLPARGWEVISEVARELVNPDDLPQAA